MRKRHRPKATWFPLLGFGQSESLFPGDSSWGRDVRMQINEDGSPDLLVAPLIWDAPQEPDAVTGDTTPLVDFVGNEYILQRIVGSIFAAYEDSGDGNNSNIAVSVIAGLFVARAQDSKGSPSGVDTPLGFDGTPGEDNRNFSPDNISTAREPWIWRRKWILSNPESVNTSNLSIAYPAGNFAYGSMADGPKVDSRIKRRIGNDDRLWIAVCVRTYPTFEVYTIGDGNQDAVRVNIDLRVLGTLRKARNRSTF